MQTGGYGCSAGSIGPRQRSPQATLTAGTSVCNRHIVPEALHQMLRGDDEFGPQSSRIEVV